MRRLLPALLRSVSVGASPAGQPVLEAIAYLNVVEVDGQHARLRPPLSLVERAWRRSVRRDGTLDVKTSPVCALDRLRKALRRRDLFVAPSVRSTDPRVGLLEGAAWEGLRPCICRTLDHTSRVVASHLPRTAAVRIEHLDGHDDLILTGLDTLDEPASLVALRAAVAARLPRVDLPEILLEIAARTGFTPECTHITARDARAVELATSLCAGLIAEAYHIGSEPLVRADVPALRRSHLSWVNQHDVRHDTLTEANARLVAAQNQIPLVHRWGGGEVASADGLRCVVPVRTVHAGPHPTYFGIGRGVTYDTLVSDPCTGLKAMLVPGTLRDSLVLLRVVLDQPTERHPTDIMTDTGAYTDVIFGLLWLLGYQCSPRLADIGGARFWRIDPSADDGSLKGIARHTGNTELMARHWDDVLRLAGSLKMGLVPAASLMRTLQVGARPTRLAQAVAELGRIDTTLHALTDLDDETKRRRTLTPLNRGEDRHTLARAVFHGKRGELRQHDRAGHEDHLDALGLVVNIIVLWNTMDMDAALEQRRHEGYPVNPEDVARLSPLTWGHIHLLGRYAFARPEAVARGELRPLRTPNDPSDDDH